jgi:hypothetical protein
MTSPSGQTARSTDTTTNRIDPTRLTLYQADGTEHDVGGVEGAITTRDMDVATRVVERLGYYGSAPWIDRGALRIFHAALTFRDDGTLKSETTAQYPYCAVLEHQGFSRVIVFETLHSLAQFLGEWLPIVELLPWTESRGEA